jgi:hypothetical protein
MRPDDQRQDEMTRLGLMGLAPLWAPAVLIWAAPLVVPMSAAALLVEIALAYAAVIAGYLAGVGAGAMLARPDSPREPFVFGMAAALIAWFAILPIGPLAPAMRAFLIILVLIYLLLRDLRAVSGCDLPGWYGALRVRLTFWASLAILLIMSRLILWDRG